PGEVSVFFHAFKDHEGMGRFFKVLGPFVLSWFVGVPAQLAAVEIIDAQGNLVLVILGVLGGAAGDLDVDGFGFLGRIERGDAGGGFIPLEGDDDLVAVKEDRANAGPVVLAGFPKSLHGLAVFLDVGVLAL